MTQRPRGRETETEAQNQRERQEKPTRTKRNQETNPRRLGTQRDTLTYKRGKEREAKAEIFFNISKRNTKKQKKRQRPRDIRDKEERKLKSRN